MHVCPWNECIRSASSPSKASADFYAYRSAQDPLLHPDLAGEDGPSSADHLSKDPEVAVSARHGVRDGKSQSPPGITAVQRDVGLGRHFRELEPGRGRGSPCGSGRGTLSAQGGSQHLLAFGPLSRGFPRGPTRPKGQKGAHSSCMFVGCLLLGLKLLTAV